MFTGLVETLGTVRRVETLDDGVELTIVAKLANELTVGESIAVNGACLTAVGQDAKSFRVQAGFETLKRTNLGELCEAHRVNLERALCVGDRLGGHLVCGHVDCIGTIRSRERRGEFELFWFACPPEWTRQMVPKGSIAVDGISLTVARLELDRFDVQVVPFTMDHTNLGQARPRDPVNLECDMVGRYVVRAIELAGLTVGERSREQRA